MTNILIIIKELFIKYNLVYYFNDLIKYDIMELYLIFLIIRLVLKYKYN